MRRKGLRNRDFDGGEFPALLSVDFKDALYSLLGLQRDGHHRLTYLKVLDSRDVVDPRVVHGVLDYLDLPGFGHLTGESSQWSDVREHLVDIRSSGVDGNQQIPVPVYQIDAYLVERDHIVHPVRDGPQSILEIGRFLDGGGRVQQRSEQLHCPVQGADKFRVGYGD